MQASDFAKDKLEGIVRNGLGTNQSETKPNGFIFHQIEIQHGFWCFWRV